MASAATPNFPPSDDLFIRIPRSRYPVLLRTSKDVVTPPNLLETYHIPLPPQDIPDTSVPRTVVRRRKPTHTYPSPSSLRPVGSHVEGQSSMKAAGTPNNPLISRDCLGSGVSAQEASTPTSSSSISPKAATPSRCIPLVGRSKSSTLSPLLARSESTHTNYSVYHPFGNLASSLSDVPTHNGNAFASNAGDPMILDPITPADIVANARNGRNQRRPIGRSRASATESDVQMQTLADVSAAATPANGSSSRKRRGNGNGPATSKRRKRETEDDDSGAYPQPSKRSTRGSRTATSSTPVASPSIGEAVLPGTDEPSADEVPEREARPRRGRGDGPAKRGAQRSNSSTNENGGVKEEDVRPEAPKSAGDDGEATMMVDPEADSIQQEPTELALPDGDALDTFRAITTLLEADIVAEVVMDPTLEGVHAVPKPTIDENVSQSQHEANSAAPVTNTEPPIDLPLRAAGSKEESTSALSSDIDQELRGEGLQEPFQL